MKNADKKWNRIFYLALLLFKDLFRRRVTLLILFIIPALFNIVILVITSEKQDPVVFGILDDDPVRMISRQSLSFVYMGCAAVSFLTSFMAFNLVFKRVKVDQRLANCGYQPIQIITGKIIVLIVLVITISIYESLIILPFLSPLHFLRLFAGFFLAGLVYSCYGLFIGAISKHELEGIFLIILVANVDVGWLQNPIYFLESANQQVIKSMPGFLPAQLANLGAFSNEFPPVTIWGSVLYASAFFLGAAFVFWLRIKRRNRGLVRL